MSKQLVVHDTTTQTLESLDPMNATGVPLPCWQVVSALPAAGQVAGEAYLVTATRTGYVWTGTNFVPIVPSALLNYPTDAALLADNTQQPGSYGVSMATGNLFISMAGGAWHAVGVRSYATEAAMKTDRNAVEGDTAWTQDTNQLWYFNAGKWFTLGVHYYATEADMIADAANAPGGGLACASDTSLMFSMPTVAGAPWQPMSIAQFANEAAMRAKTTDNIAHQIAITQDQNRIYVWTGTAWIGSPVEYFATEAALLAATPPVGVLGIAGDTGKPYVRKASSWQALAGPTFTTGTTAPTTGVATGDMFFDLAHNILQVRGSTKWETVGSKKSDLWCVGSIQQSLLTEAQFNAEMGSTTDWVLADGRSCAGTRYAAITGNANVMDMRGGFFRAAGQNSNSGVNWNGGTLGSYHDDTTRMPRTPFTTASDGAHTHTTDSQGNHNHTWGKSSRQSKGGPDYMVVDGWDQDRYTSSAGAHTHTAQSAGAHTHTINGGDTFTAPVHFSLNTFIKVN